MKKSLFFAAAASALMLTACSSENDVVQSAPQTQETAAQAVGFDVYMPQAVTRAGDPAGVMTTDKLKTPSKGFGVFAMYQNNADYASGLTPNFMFNEHVSWSGGWTYSPLKYWPNETTNDSQAPAATAAQKDKLSFFAYAPYVGTLTTEGTMVTELPSTTTNAMVASPAETSGIISITRANYGGDPLVEYAISADPDNNVDLLWGVAPAGMSYTDVSNNTSGAPVGMPLLNMVKPDKDQKMKFLFQHALSRIGLSVVSAIDQIAAGDDGDKYKTAQTRVLIEDVKIWGTFGKKGVLNLNNGTANVANWIETSVDRTASTELAPQFTITSANGYLAPDLRYDESKLTGTGTVEDTPSKFADLNEGVLPSEKALMVGGPDPSKAVTDPAFEVGKVYYKQDGVDYIVATTSATNAVDAYELTGTYDAAGSYFTQVFKTDGSTKATVSGNTKQLYTFTMTEKDASVNNIAVDAVYYTRTGSDGTWVYTWNKNTTGAPIATGTYYEISSKADLAVDHYAAGDYWTGLLPRYFMVIPSALPSTPTTVNVKITYHVVTKDEKLTGNVSNVSNAITKETSIQLQSGKSYNLKLILGLTSVKLDATVADWQVADDAEIWLPKNNE